ncbi:hypothetical protein CXB49_07485 [Chromobacterium sp. ATCC 53434]|nr:hypothetical protein CXB49_07485 [Chromobacterium sp. ATCC 53434]
MRKGNDFFVVIQAFISIAIFLNEQFNRYLFCFKNNLITLILSSQITIGSQSFIDSIILHLLNK